MQIPIKLFAAARQLAGQDELMLTVPASARVADVRRALLQQVPELESLSQFLVFAVDADYADDDTPVATTSEVAVIPPVSGG